MEFVLGIIFGICVTLFALAYNSTSGTLKVFIPDTEDESICMGVDLNEPIDRVCKKKAVIFAVKVEQLNSQK